MVGLERGNNTEIHIYLCVGASRKLARRAVAAPLVSQFSFLARLKCQMFQAVSEKGLHGFPCVIMAIAPVERV